MCLFTHFAAGALVGGATGNVWLGAGAGFVSHAVLDAIPHYDHPDWRLELFGGILSLIILVLLPFGTLPAIVGGIFGMVPDLENLFQKLGKMRRDQFIYPSHTGLVPHGRTLGPKSIIWQVAIFVVCFALLGLIVPGNALAQSTFAEGTPSYKVVSAEPQCQMEQPEVTVLGASANNSLVRIDFPVSVAPADWNLLDPFTVQWGLPVTAENSDVSGGPIVPVVAINIAVPTTAAISGRVVSVTWWKQPQGISELAALSRKSTPAVFRSVPLWGTEIPVLIDGGIPASLVLEISHPVDRNFVVQLEKGQDASAGGRQSSAGDSVPAGVLNGMVFSQLSRGGHVLATERATQDRNNKNAKAQIVDYFGLTDNWVRLEVDETGLFSISGQDLLVMGVSTGNVDPDKLRLYRGGGLPLEFNPTLPDTLQRERASLTEISIDIVGGQDGEWNLDDEIHFFAFGSSHYLNRLDATANPLDHFDHPYSEHAIYWLTWESIAEPSPLPGTPLRIATVAAPGLGGEPVVSHRLRQHYEQQYLDNPGLVYDGFIWHNNILASHSESFSAYSPLPGTSVRVTAELRADPAHNASTVYPFEASGWINDQTGQNTHIAFESRDQNDSLKVRLVIDCDEVASGTNSFTLRNDNPPFYDYQGNPLTKQPWVLDSFDVSYLTKLDFERTEGQLVFSHWKDQVTGPNAPLDLKIEVDATVSLNLWDVTDHTAPQIFTGQSEGTSPVVMTYGFLGNPGIDRHFVAFDPNSMLSVTSGTVVSPPSLRTIDPGVDYILLYHDAFSGPGQRLADFHDTTLLGLPSPEAQAYCIQDVYDNYSGGQKDPFAIRNFLRDIYDRGGMRLKYFCILGNASRDYRNYLDRVPLIDLYDLIPTEVRTPFPAHPMAVQKLWPYASDDGLVSFDVAVENRIDYPDLACGRLPATTLAEAEAMVERCIDYIANPEPGLWANNALIVADDNYVIARYGNNPYASENKHTVEAEKLAEEYFPISLDVNKIFGVEYPFPPGSIVKPQCRNDINAAISAGTTIYHYIGHGSPDNLADEQIFQSSDIPNLTNGAKRPVFVAFSCDVGIFDSPRYRSMGESFLVSENGGAIGAICASQVSYSFANNELGRLFYQNVFPQRHIPTGLSVAWGLLQAKASVASEFTQLNSQRYNYFGDPGMSFVHPRDDLVLASTSVDTLRAGALQKVVLAADGKSILLGSGDQYDVSVQEASYDYFYPNNSLGTLVSFNQPGSEVFRGSGTMGSGDLVIPFKVPVQLRYGDKAKVRLLINAPDGTHAAVMELPSIRAALEANNDIVGPDIRLKFQSGSYQVQPGDELKATLHDTSSIAILGTSPGNSLMLEFDNTGFMTDVTSYFNFDADSYMQGSVGFPLPGDLELGLHKAALHASDSLGNVGSDTLSFELVAEGLTGIRDMSLFPNPTPGKCRLLFNLSDPMDVRWEIYSLSGRRLKTVLGHFTASGAKIMHWDGLDDQNEEIANGTYLYVLRGSGNSQRDVTKTGKLVIMR